MFPLPRPERLGCGSGALNSREPTLFAVILALGRQRFHIALACMAKVRAKRSVAAAALILPLAALARALTLLRGARSQASHSSSEVGITGPASPWISFIFALEVLVKNGKTSWSSSFVFPAHLRPQADEERDRCFLGWRRHQARPAIVQSPIPLCTSIQPPVSESPEKPFKRTLAEQPRPHCRSCK